MDKELAWVTQSTDALYSILDRDPFFLKNIDMSPFVHTPLHEASVRGNKEMAAELMSLMPSFARKLDTRGFTPLHLALENHRDDVALQLLMVDPYLIRLHGRGGVTPLHVVAERGNVDVLTKFLTACPECVTDVNIRGETALHIAVLNGRDDELKLLVRFIQRMKQSGADLLESEIMNKKDRDGNSVLHVAASENKHEAVKLLLKCVSVDRNIQNEEGFTPLDLLRANGPYMNHRTERLIKKSGGKSKTDMPRAKTASERLRSPVSFWEFCSTAMVRYRNGISDGTRNALLVITTLVATATYETALQPPVPKEFYDVHVTVVALVLWLFNTISFVLAVTLNFILLPRGRKYRWCYALISVPLYCSYGIAVYMNSMDGSWQILILPLIAIMLGFACYLLFIYGKWKRFVQMKE